jgi:hypothetical protein
MPKLKVDKVESVPQGTVLPVGEPAVKGAVWG